MIQFCMKRSPAIDAGSDDAWGYDTTSTNSKVIDMGQPDLGYHYYRRVADDDPIDDPVTPQIVEFTFVQPDLPDTMNLEKYIVPNPLDPENPLHLISSTDTDLGGGYTQEGFEGKRAVKGILKGVLEEKKEHTIQLITQIEGGQKSKPSEIKVIVDPDPPIVTVQ